MPFRLALDSRARVLLAQDAYAVYRFEAEGDPAGQVGIASAGREREEYWERTALGSRATRRIACWSPRTRVLASNGAR